MYLKSKRENSSVEKTKYYSLFIYSSTGKLECKGDCCTIDQLDSVLQDTPGRIRDMHGENTMSGVLPEKINLSH